MATRTIYKVVDQYHVNEHLDDGWALHGSPIIGRASAIRQAVIKTVSDRRGLVSFPVIRDAVNVLTPDELESWLRTVDIKSSLKVSEIISLIANQPEPSCE